MRVELDSGANHPVSAGSSPNFEADSVLVIDGHRRYALRGEQYWGDAQKATRLYEGADALTPVNH